MVYQDMDIVCSAFHLGLWERHNLGVSLPLKFMYSLICCVRPLIIKLICLLSYIYELLRASTSANPLFSVIIIQNLPVFPFYLLVRSAILESIAFLRFTRLCLLLQV